MSNAPKLEKFVRRHSPPLLPSRPQSATFNAVTSSPTRAISRDRALIAQNARIQVPPVNPPVSNLDRPRSVPQDRTSGYLPSQANTQAKTSFEPGPAKQESFSNINHGIFDTDASGIDETTSSLNGLQVRDALLSANRGYDSINPDNDGEAHGDYGPQEGMSEDFGEAGSDQGEVLHEEEESDGYGDFETRPRINPDVLASLNKEIAQNKKRLRVEQSNLVRKHGTPAEPAFPGEAYFPQEIYGTHWNVSTRQGFVPQGASIPAQRKPWPPSSKGYESEDDRKSMMQNNQQSQTTTRPRHQPSNSQQLKRSGPVPLTKVQGSHHLQVQEPQIHKPKPQRKVQIQSKPHEHAKQEPTFQRLPAPPAKQLPHPHAVPSRSNTPIIPADVKPISTLLAASDLNSTSTSPTSPILDETQLQEDDVIIQQPPKRRLSLDYPLEKLSVLNPNDVFHQSFDHVPAITQSRPPPSPSPNKFPFTYDPSAPPTFLPNLTQLSASDLPPFFSTLPLGSWQATGDWLLERLGQVVKEMDNARQERRNVADQFEKEIEDRYKKVEAAREDVEERMGRMKKGGLEVLNEKSK
ncbi:MAG: hypothetical protein M1834_007822 [Cirrosporium novae-zelandiae]|nr:MAG: hypothetical protein M1834_007822 [Cirrosporium novae-zelandiae]